MNKCVFNQNNDAHWRKKIANVFFKGKRREFTKIATMILPHTRMDLSCITSILN